MNYLIEFIVIRFLARRFPLTFSHQKLLPGMWKNLLGLQAFRVACARSISRRRLTEEMLHLPEEKALVRDGYCIILNFLPPDEFEKLRSEYKYTMNSTKNLKKVIKDSRGYIRETYYMDNNKLTIPTAWTTIHQNSRLRRLLRVPEGVDEEDFVKGEFQVAFWRSYLGETEIEAIQSDHTNVELHSDTFHTITKAFFYIEDTDKSNGAHRYVPGSHRLGLRRLIFEYLNSVFAHNGSPRVSERQLTWMGLEAKDLELPANTLIVENTFGFHGAGTIQPDACRELIYAQFRWPAFGIVLQESQSPKAKLQTSEVQTNAN